MKKEIFVFIFVFVKNDHCFLPSTIITRKMNILKLPIDVLHHNILPNIGIQSIITLVKINKVFHKNKRNLYSYIIKDDKVLIEYKKIYNLDIIRTLSESSISFKLFDDLNYSLMNVNDSSNPKMNIENFKGRFVMSRESVKQYQINNTFKIFQIFKTKTENIMEDDNKSVYNKFCDIIKLLLTKYFKIIYFSRNDIETFNFKSISIINDINHYNWEHSNVNIYNIFEHLNLISYYKSSGTMLIDFKTFNDTILCQNIEQIIATLHCIQGIFLNGSHIMEDFIYIKYIVVRYLNCISEEEIINHDNTVVNSDFLQLSLNDVYEFQEEINAYSHLIHQQLRETMLKEINKYIEYIHEHFIN